MTTVSEDMRRKRRATAAQMNSLWITRFINNDSQYTRFKQSKIGKCYDVKHVKADLYNSVSPEKSDETNFESYASVPQRNISSVMTKISKTPITHNFEAENYHSLPYAQVQAAYKVSKKLFLSPNLRVGK